MHLQRAIRDALSKSMGEQSLARLSRPVRDDAGDTIFSIDVDAEGALLRCCEAWGKDEAFVLIAEGLPGAGSKFGAGDPRFRLIVDPIDGTRALMFDKRSAWSLAATAPMEGGLASIELAAMTELPTTRMHIADTLWAERGSGASGVRENLITREKRAFTPSPSRAQDLRHGFASVANYFPGGKELTARLDERLMTEALGGWNPDKCEVYTDQYVSSGGQLAELALGRDRFVLDVRPLVHRALGITSSLCARPYDLCTMLVAQEAGCVVTAPDGSRLDAPLDVTTSVAFVAFANQELARRLQPLVTAALEGLKAPARRDPPPQSTR